MIRWSIEQGKPLGQFGRGGQAYAWYDIAYSPNPSIQSVLVDAGLLPQSVNDPVNDRTNKKLAYMVTYCNFSDTSTTRVLLAKPETPPPNSVTEQIGRACTHPLFTSYTTPPYGMNYGVLVEAAGS